jgi:salicylate synthetase
MSSAPFRTVVLPARTDDLGGVLALVGSGLFTDYVTYERNGTRWFAGGVRAAVTMDRRSVRWTVDGLSDSVPFGDQPLGVLGKVVRGLLRGDRRAYGYLAFEVAYLLHGVVPPAVGSGPLAHLTLPEVEVVWSPEDVTVSGTDPSTVDAVVDLLLAAGLAPDGPVSPLPTAGPGSRSRYEATVAELVGSIRSGLLRKAIVSRRLDVPFPVDLARTYAAGLSRNTPARSYLLRLGDRRCAGFSPETVAEVGADGSVSTQPLAGTRPLLHEPDADRRLREELKWDVKECYEHVISARLADDELRGVCVPGSVAVRDLLAVRERGTVQHLASRVTGRLRPGLDAWDALTALFPAVTASGIPKPGALRAIAALEDGPREMYAGTVCLVDGSGALDSALVLRSAYQDAAGSTWLRAGAGIVADSDPAAEYDETSNKLASVAGSLVAATAPHPVPAPGR